MKKVLVLIVVIAIGVGIWTGREVKEKVESPEFYLLKTAEDVSLHGVDGLREHMTPEMCDTMDEVLNIAELPIVSRLIQRVTGKNGKQALGDGLNDLDWSVEKTMHGENEAQIVIHIMDSSGLGGNLPVKMKREGGEWLISGIGTPTIDRKR